MEDLLIITHYDIPNWEKFIEYFKDVKSKNLMIFFPFESVVEPFIFYNDNKYPEFFIELENMLIENGLTIFAVYGSFFDKGVDNLQYRPIKNVNVLYWPTYLLHYSFYNITQSYGKHINDINIEQNFIKLFQCYNRKPRTHRMMIVDFLKKYNLFEKGIISWNQLSDTWDVSYAFQYWNEEVIKIDDANRIAPEPVYFTDNLLNTGALFDICGETITSHYFLTEKTFKNLLIKQPFISIGAINQNTILKEFGFKLYDELIDYSFDSESFLIDRCEGAIKSILSLKDRNYNELYDVIKDKAEFNKRRALEIIENDPYIPQQFIEIYKNNFNKFEPNLNIPNYLCNIMVNK